MSVMYEFECVSEMKRRFGEKQWLDYSEWFSLCCLLASLNHFTDSEFSQ